MSKRFISFGGDRMVYSTLKQLIAKKEIEERRKISYRTLAEETGLSTGTLVRMCDFTGITKVEAKTIDTLCRYFKCELGDLLKFYDDTTAQLPTNPSEFELMKAAAVSMPEDIPTVDDYNKVVDELN